MEGGWDIEGNESHWKEDSIRRDFFKMKIKRLKVRELTINDRYTPYDKAATY